MSRAIMLACTCTVIGLAAGALSHLAGSSYLETFLDANLLVVLIALMAINTTTVSVILTKMREIADAHPDVDFASTRRSMRAATLEQLVLIVVAAILLAAKGSPWLPAHVPHAAFVITSLLIAVFAYALQVLFDTAKAVYVILDHGQ